MLRRFLTTGASSIVSWLAKPSSAIVRSRVVLVGLSPRRYAAVAAFAPTAAGRELYRHLETAKRLPSHWMESAHDTDARLLNWVAEHAWNGDVSIATVTAGGRNALHLPAISAASTHWINNPLAFKHVVLMTRPAPISSAVGRVAAAAAFAAPVMLTGASAGTFTAPVISTKDTARLATPLSAPRMKQGSIVVNYAPNVVIHSEDATDTAALKRRVMEVLERHGRELHKVLAREIVLQQRRDF